MAKRIKLIIFALAVAGGILAHARTASAQTSGTRIFDVGDLPDSLRDQPEYEGMRAGYICNFQGVLGAMFPPTNCHAVVYKGRSWKHGEGVTAAVNAAYSPSDIKLTWWQRYGLWVLLSVVLGLFVLGFGGSYVHKRRTQRALVEKEGNP